MNKQTSDARITTDGLKPCPCCDSEFVEMKQTHKKGFTIRCRSCGIMHHQKQLHHGNEWLKEKMKETWNTRPILKPTEN